MMEYLPPSALSLPEKSSCSAELHMSRASAELVGSHSCHHVTIFLPGQRQQPAFLEHDVSACCLPEYM